jgi:hypothetical protein
VRAVVSLLALVPALACESAPAFRAPSGPPIAVALDVRFVRYTLGQWAVDGFDESLEEQLAKYNVKVVDARAAPTFVALIDLGVPGNRRAIDVYLSRDDQPEVPPQVGRRPEGHTRTELAGRVWVTDLSQTTLEASAQLVAPLIARKAWGLDQGGEVYPGAPPP